MQCEQKDAIKLVEPALFVRIFVYMLIKKQTGAWMLDNEAG